jgi:hypothetical protein
MSGHCAPVWYYSATHTQDPPHTHTSFHHNAIDIGVSRDFMKFRMKFCSSEKGECEWTCVREISLKFAVSVRRRLASASHGTVPQPPGRAPRPRSTLVYSDPEAKPTAQSKTRDTSAMRSPQQHRSLLHPTLRLQRETRIQMFHHTPLGRWKKV